MLVNFWATWCPPCVAEMPSLQRLKDALAGEPFRILAVDMAEDAADIEAFLERVPVDFTILLDSEGEAVQAWRVFAFPSSYLVGPEGRVRYSLYGPLEWDGPQNVAIVRSLMPQAQAANSR